jgi:hypothetical protein
VNKQRLLAGMDGAQKTSDNNLLIDKTTTRALMEYLERQLGDRAKIIKANKEFTNQVTDISRHTISYFQPSPDE